MVTIFCEKHNGGFIRDSSHFDGIIFVVLPILGQALITSFPLLLKLLLLLMLLLLRWRRLLKHWRWRLLHLRRNRILPMALI